MWEKKKMEVKRIISNNRMDIAKKLENKIQNKPSFMDDKGKNREILIYDNEFFKLINNLNISKINKNQKNYISW